MRRLGVPYPPASPDRVVAEAQAQAAGIALDLAKAGAPVAADREIVALIAYLQQMGKFERVVPPKDHEAQQLGD
jgi:cytochrome c oxidase cbb3-type subunit I/II